MTPERRRFVIGLAAILALPLIFAAAGGGRGTGLAIGIALVAGGVIWGLAGSRRG